MSANSTAWQRLARNYWVWRLYHFLVADAISVQRPTKFKFVRDFLGDTLGMTADIGCGPGVFVRHMSQRAKYLVEMDIDRNSLGRVRFRHHDLQNVGFITASSYTLPFCDEYLDTILFLEVLEHLTDDSAALTEIRRVLRPNGRLILSVPVPPGEIDTKTPWGHKREGYQLAEIKSLLVKNGFQVQKFAFAEFQFSRRTAEVIRWWRKTTRLPAPIFFSWIAYLDFFLGSRKVETGTHLPATVLLLAQKSAQDRRGQSGPVAATAGSSCTESSESTRKPTSLRTAKFCFDTAARDLFHSDSVRSQIRNVFGSFRGL